MIKLNKNADSIGTYRQGTIFIKYEDLVTALGTPHFKYLDNSSKVKNEWAFETCFGTATLYDYWWNSHNEWSIGGKDKRVVKLVRNFVNQKLEILENERNEFLLNNMSEYGTD